MATYQAAKVVSLPCGENLTGDIYELLVVNASGQVVKQSTPASDVVVGVLAEEPGTTAAGDHVAVALIGGGGVLKCKAGAAITNGHLLICDATDGRAAGVANVAGIGGNQTAFGQALEAAADGEIFEFLAFHLTGNA